MEKSNYDYRSIQQHDENHVSTDAHDGTMTISPNSSEAGRAYLDGRRAGMPSVGHLSQPTMAGLNTFSLLRRQRHSFSTWGHIFLLIISLWLTPISAVFVKFENCLSEATQTDEPLQLQFIPKFVNAVFDTTDSVHNLTITVWGNVNGSTVELPRLIVPPANDSDYWNSNQTYGGGKILDNPFPDSAKPKLTTLSNKVDILTYEPFVQTVDFCSHLGQNASCPLGPVFNASGTPYDLPSFGLTNNFASSYAFTSLTATLLVKYGDENATPIGCISANVTPNLGPSLSAIVTFTPMVILIFVGVATAFAAVFSPWGTTDPFRWTTNYGRDADLLRLVTPGFGDCLQYIQFIALTGGLTLSYPGFYQPIVSKVSWSALMFNESFVSHGNGTNSLMDGMYVTNGTYGLDNLRQLIGMSAVKDVWAGMAVWLLVIIGIVLVFIQACFFFRWAYRHINNTTEEDLRAKNWPLSVGNVIRIVFNYFLLPIVSLSMFQLVVAGDSPAYTVALAVVMLVFVFGFSGWLLFVIAFTRPKSYLLEDLRTVLIYGPLYNTYSDHAAPYALVPILLTFIRGVAIGAIQPSGIAQLVLLAICEVITLLTLQSFRPFHAPTSMNIYHTFCAALRFSIILLMIPFAPSLGVTEGPKGWIGYAILLIHAIVLILGFLLNALQTIVEVGARMAGAGGDESGATRGGLVKVFGMRQLSKRLPRRDGGSRQSQLSSAAMLDTENDRKSYLMDNGRLRSQSAGSAGVLLSRQSVGLESNGAEPFGAISPQQLGSGNSAYTPTTPGEVSTYSFLPSAARTRAPTLGALAAGETADPYYRPPRLRRPTLEAYSPGAKSRGSWASGDWVKRWSQAEPGTVDQTEEGPSVSGWDTPSAPTPLDASAADPRRAQADYTTREVDFYYGVRGPALNANIPSRRIKTGPADPTGPAASAAGWFKGLFGGKTKEKGKGFEVVRSARMPPGMVARNTPGAETPPEGVPVATGVIRNGPIDSDDESTHVGPSIAISKPAVGTTNEGENLVSHVGSEDEDSQDEDEEFEVTRISDLPPVLPGIEIPGGGIELPSRFPSKATSKASSRRPKMVSTALVPDMPLRAPSNKPSVPRKSSKRRSQNIDPTLPENDFMQQHRPHRSLDLPTREPFERSNSNAQNSDVSTRSGVTDPAIATPHSRTASSALGHLSVDDRPTSVGYVPQHSILTVNPSENPQFLGTSAEVVDGRRSNASSMENQ